jgi:hypothetical protein
MALVHSQPGCCARNCCCAPAASSSRATCSTGGTRRKGAACARACPTTTCGCRWPRALCRGDRRHGRARRADVRLPRGPPGQPPRSPTTTCRCVRHSASLYRARARGGGARPAVRRPWPAADRHRRLERRHEPRSVIAAAAKASGSASSCAKCCAASPAGARHGDDAAARVRVQRTARRSCAARSSRPGTANGIGAPISTTARRSARLPTRRMPDRLDRAELVGAVRRGDPSGHASAMDALYTRLVRPDARSRCCSTRRSTRRDRAPATSPAICPACAKTAANTTTQRSGRRWRSPRWASASAPGRCWRSSTRSTADHADGVARYKVEPYVMAADVYTVAAAHRTRRLELVHGFRRVDVPADRGVAARPAAADNRHRCPAGVLAVPAGRLAGVHP